LRAILAEPECGVRLLAEVELPFPDIADPELRDLKAAHPEIVFIDLESDPHVGLKFAGFLLESGTAQNLVAIGADLSPEILLQAMRAGILEVIPRPVTRDEVLEALERVWRRTGRKSRRAERTAPGMAICVFGVKGGTGSTTVSTNLAVEIHRLTRKKVLLLDLDLELGETALQLGVDPKFSVVDLIRNFHRVDSDLLASYIETHETGVDLLAAPYRPADYEAVSGERVREVITFLKGHYDYVVVDTPKTFNPASFGAFAEADLVYLVTTADIPAIRNLSRSLPLLKQLGGRKTADRFRLIVNRFDPAQVISVEEISKTVGLEVHWTLRNDYRAVMDSINEGTPAVTRSGSPFGRDMRALTSELTGVPLAEAQKKGRLGTLLTGWKNGRG
jgi:pilus assembly protein CpaE